MGEGHGHFVRTLTLRWEATGGFLEQRGAIRLVLKGAILAAMATRPSGGREQKPFRDCVNPGKDDGNLGEEPLVW